MPDRESSKGDQLPNAPEAMVPAAMKPRPTSSSMSNFRRPYRILRLGSQTLVTPQAARPAATVDRIISGCGSEMARYAGTMAPPVVSWTFS